MERAAGTGSSAMAGNYDVVVVGGGISGGSGGAARPENVRRPLPGASARERSQTEPVVRRGRHRCSGPGCCRLGSVGPGSGGVGGGSAPRLGLRLGRWLTGVSGLQGLRMHLGGEKKKGKMIRVDVLGRICCFLPWFVLRARQKRVCRKTDFYRVHRCRRMQGERLGLSHPGKDGVWKLRVFRVLLQCWQLYSFDKYCRKTGGNICKNRLGFVTRSAVLQTAKFHSCDGLFTLY